METDGLRLYPLSVACPACGSAEVVYSCHPDCCFNHVCSACLQSFELSTEYLGRDFDIGAAGPIEKDSTAPTTECARCHSLEVYHSNIPEDATVICASCHALLRLMTSA